MDQNEVIRLAFQYDGSGAVKAGNDIDSLNDKLRRSFTANSSMAAAFSDPIASMGNGFVSAGVRADQFKQKTVEAGAGSRNMGMAILEGSRALEDLQYGLNGVLNNLPSLVMSLGGGPGVAGALSVAAVGANLLYQNWGLLQSAFDMGSTQTEADRMAELGKQVKKTAEETATYNRYQKEQATLKRVDEGTSAKSQADESAVSKAITEAQARGGEVSGAVAAIMLESGKFRDPAAEAKIKGYRDQGFDKAAEALQREEDIRRQDEALAAAKDLVGGAVNDPLKRKALEGYIDQKPEAFAPGLLGDLANAAPGEREKQEALERQGEQIAKQIERDARARSDAIKASNEAADAVFQALDDQIADMKRVRLDIAERRKNMNGPGREAFEFVKDAELKAEREDAKAWNENQDKKRKTEREGAIDRAGNLTAKIAMASGLQDPIQMAMAQAQMARAGDRNYMTRFNRLGFEAQQAEIGKQNDRDDQAIGNMVYRDLKSRNVSEFQAQKTAQAMVAQARAERNGMTGDLSTKAADDNTNATKDLTAKIEELKRDGIYARVK